MDKLLESETPKTLIPETREELSAMIRQASIQKEAVIPWGSGTHQDSGHPPAKLHKIIRSEKLNRVLDYSEKDFVITVESGITLAKLQAFLDPYHQFFPYFGPLASKRTLGGIISAGSRNCLAYRYGQTRELLLGITVCQADGTFIKGGGKVVKNVSGYEMPKLFVGALGTLGYVTDLTLRLYAQAEKIQILTFLFPLLKIGFQALGELFHSRILLSMAVLEVHPSRIALHLRLEGGTRLVQKEEIALKKIPYFNMEGEKFKWHRHPSPHDFNPFALLEKSPLAAMGSIPPAQGMAFSKALFQTARRSGLEGHLFFSLDGSFHAGFKGNPSPYIVKNFENLNQTITSLGGWVAYLRVPEFLWRDWPMWGEEQNEWKLSFRLKEFFDPKGIFNPKRFVGRR